VGSLFDYGAEAISHEVSSNSKIGGGEELKEGS
jgi:hypothetical protein